MRAVAKDLDEQGYDVKSYTTLTNEAAILNRSIRGCEARIGNLLAKKSMNFTKMAVCQQELWQNKYV